MLPTRLGSSQRGKQPYLTGVRNAHARNTVEGTKKKVGVGHLSSDADVALVILSRPPARSKSTSRSGSWTSPRFRDTSSMAPRASEPFTSAGDRVSGNSLRVRLFLACYGVCVLWAHMFFMQVKVMASIIPGSDASLLLTRSPCCRLEPIMNGGGQERGLRSGTVPAPLAVGMGAAARIAKQVCVFRILPKPREIACTPTSTALAFACF